MIYDSLELEFPEELTQEQFEDYICQATIKALEHVPDHPEDIVFYDDTDVKNQIDIYEFFQDIVNELVGLGFKLVTYTSKVHLDSGASPLVDIFGECKDEGNLIKKIRESIPPELKERIKLAAKKQPD
jgi:hypothetical protein